MKTRTGFDRAERLWRNGRRARPAAARAPAARSADGRRHGRDSRSRRPGSRQFARRPRARVYPTSTRVKHRRLCASIPMPFLVLLLISLSAGALVFYVGSHYPTPLPVVGGQQAEGTTEHIETEMERHPWLLRLVRGRLDPATATGLALTLALGLAIRAGCSSAPLRTSCARATRSSTRTGPWASGASTTPRPGRPTRSSS